MLYRRIFTQVPLQYVCNKVIYIKSGKFVNIFSVRVDLLGWRSVLVSSFLCKAVFSWSVHIGYNAPKGLQGRIIPSLDMSLETFEKINK